jgi:hypothetical protein
MHLDIETERADGSTRTRRWLAHRRLPVVLAAMAVVLSAPSLWLGLQVDDYALRLALARPAIAPTEVRSPLRLFELVRDPAQVRGGVAAGFFPWWTSPDLRIAFFRPLTGLTHWVDFHLWPRQPWIMHLQSLLWFALVVAAVALLFHRLLTPAWVAGLAGLLYAVDDAHGMAAAWLANRNALVAAAFGVLALLAHDRWRRDSWGPGLFLAPLALALGLCGGETAVAVGGYLLAYALFVDHGPWRSRIVSLLPTGLVGASWALVYRAFAFGTQSSGMYISPLGDPAQFARTVVERAPLLLCGQWLLPSELHLLLSRDAARIMWIGAVVLGVVLAILLGPLLRHDRVARFFAGGMLLSLIPASGAFPDDRLLILAGVGGSGLLAQLLAGMAMRAPWLPRARAWRWPATGAAAVLVLLHLILAPVGLMRGAAKMRSFGDVVNRAAASLPSDANVRHQQVLIVQTPAAFVSVLGPLIQAAWGHAIPARTLVLGSGIFSTTVERPSDRILRVRPAGGYLLPEGQAPQGPPQPAFDLRYMFMPFDHLYRDSPMQLGEMVVIPGITVEVTQLTSTGRPAEATFTFDRPLDDTSLRWVRWSNGVYVPFDLPAIGETVTLPRIEVPLFESFSRHS